MIAIKIVLVVFLLILDIILVRSVLKGAPFAPTNSGYVKRMLEIAKVKPGELAVDIGSGDGRIVIALAKAGCEAHGYENNVFLVWLSRFKIKRAGLAGKATIHHKSFWQQDFSKYSVVTIFGMSHFMAKLSEKLQAELKPGARVVCNTYSLPNWKPETINDRIYLYKN